VRRKTNIKRARGPLSALLLGLAAVALTATGASADLVLNCNFESHTVGEPVPTGGAANGEPVDLGGTGAIVAISPAISKAVKVTDIWDDSAGYVRFDFINAVEITSGEVTVEAQLCFIGQNNYSFSVREQNGRAENFSDLIFTDGGAVHFQDADSPQTLVWSYSAGATYNVRYVFDLDTGTYSLEFNGVRLLIDEPCGVTSGRGIGGLYVGFDNDTDTVGAVFIDDIWVESTASVDADAHTWSLVKSMFR
jgi:hypothetical protein